MTALAHETPPDVEEGWELDETSGLDEALWQAWKTLELPEGYRAEIVEGFIEVSPTGRRRHGILANRLRRALDLHLTGSGYAAYQDINVIHGRKVWIPDVFVASEDLDEIPDPEGLGVDGAGVLLVAEIVSPGHNDRERDRVRKRRAYARAGIPVYVLIDDHDGRGSVTVLSSPDRKTATYAAESRVPYGRDVAIPEGPAKGFAITPEITG